MRVIVSVLILCLCCLFTNAQVSINNSGAPPAQSAMLEVKSNSKGFLPPRMTWTEIQAIQNPEAGLMVYDIGIKAFRSYNGIHWDVIGSVQQGLNSPSGYFSSYAGEFSGVNAVINDSELKKGNFAVCGSLNGTLQFTGDLTITSAGMTDAVVAMYDSIGHCLWAFTLGNTSEDNAYYITVDPSGNVIVAGSFNGIVDFDPGPGTTSLNAVSQNWFMAKYSPAGELVWVIPFLKPYSGLICDAAGSIFFTGYFTGTYDFDPGPGVSNLSSTLGGYDTFFGKYDSNGNFVWTKYLSSPGTELGAEITMLNGNIILAGEFENTIDMDPSGAVLNLTSAGGDDFFFASYDATGNLLWARRIGNANNEMNTRVAIDGQNNICLGGTFSGTIDIDPGAPIVNLVSSGTDLFVSKYNSSGNYLSYGFKIGNTGDDRITSIDADQFGNIYLSGKFNGTVDFDIGTPTYNLTSNGSSDFFIGKYSPSATMIFAASAGGLSNGLSKLNLSPNGKLIFVHLTSVSTPWISFNGTKQILNRFVFVRYEE